MYHVWRQKRRLFFFEDVKMGAYTYTAHHILQMLFLVYSTKTVPNNIQVMSSRFFTVPSSLFQCKNTFCGIHYCLILKLIELKMMLNFFSFATKMQLCTWFIKFGSFYLTSNFWVLSSNSWLALNKWTWENMSVIQPYQQRWDSIWYCELGNSCNQPCNDTSLHPRKTKLSWINIANLCISETSTYWL